MSALCLSGLAVYRVFGSAGDYLIDITTGEKGLPNSSVTAIAQTPDGYLWVGTYNGLARFDGERFVKFYPENTPALRNARIRRLVTSPDGTLWISAHDGSITTHRDGRFSLEWAGEGVADSAATLISFLNNQPVFLLRTGEVIRRSSVSGTNRWELLRSPGATPGLQVAADAEGVIWSVGREQKIFRLIGNAFEMLPGNGGLEGEVLNVLTADKQGRIWAGTDRGIAVWNGARFENMTPTNGATANVSFLRVLSNGDVWSIANDRLRKSHGREWVFEVEEARGLFAGSRERTGLHEDSKGGVWLYDYGRGLFHVRPDGRVRQLTAEEDFPGERVDAFLEDREGNIWAGVDRGGLVRLREKRFSVLLPGSSPEARAAVSVTEDDVGAIWVGTFGGGLHRWHQNHWQTFTLPGGTRRGFVFSVASDEDGKLWTSAGEEDLYSGASGKFSLFSPSVHGVKALLRASDGRLWVGTKSGLGVIVDGQLRQFTQEDGMARTDVRALAEDGAGDIWVGMGDGTLYRVATNAVVTAFRTQDAWASLPIWSVLADQDGVVWVGTFRGGLLRFRDGRFVRMTTQDGLPGDVISQLLDDGDGRLWAGTKQGIFHVSKAELHRFADTGTGTINCNAYGRYDGLPSLECSDSYQPAAWRTRDGRLLFTTLRGVVSVRPGEVAANSLPPPVVIESAIVDGQEQQAGVFGAVGPRLVVPPGRQQIKIQFTGLSFTSPDRVRFKYKLEPLDREWSEPTTARNAQYNLLPPGEHRFLVTACNNDGVWNETGAALSLVVLPHFYETWTFKLAAGVAVVGLVAFGVRRVYTRRLHRQLELLERQRAIERDRTRIAKDIHDDLGAGLTHIALLSELARRDTPEEMPHHVSQISEMARELTRNMDEIVWAVDPQNDTLDSLVTYVSKFAQEYLSVAGIRCRLDAPAELPPYVLPAEVRHNLFLAIKEALNNVVKHARASEVWLRVVVRPSSFCVVVEDNGCGLDSGANDNALNGQNHRISTGHGLVNMQRRLRSIGGRCFVGSEPGKGTRTELSVDLKLPRSPELATGKRAGLVEHGYHQ